MPKNNMIQNADLNIIQIIYCSTMHLNADLLAIKLLPQTARKEKQIFFNYLKLFAPR